MKVRVEEPLKAGGRIAVEVEDSDFEGEFVDGISSTERNARMTAKADAYVLQYLYQRQEISEGMFRSRVTEIKERLAQFE